MRPCYCDNCPKPGNFKSKMGYCFFCWKFHNNAKFHAQCGGTEPTMLEKAKNLAGALTKHTLSGFATLNDEQFLHRMLICDTCPFNKEGTCTKCGCSLKIKARFATQNCPLELWPKIEQGNSCGCGSKPTG